MYYVGKDEDGDDFSPNYFSYSEEDGFKLDMKLLNDSLNLEADGVRVNFTFNIRAVHNSSLSSPHVDKEINLEIIFFDCTPIQILPDKNETLLAYDIDLESNSHEVMLSEWFKTANDNCPITGYLILMGNTTSGASPTSDQAEVFLVDNSTGNLTIDSSVKGKYELFIFSFNSFNNAYTKVSLTIFPCKKDIVSLGPPPSYNKGQYYDSEVKGTQVFTITQENILTQTDIEELATSITI
jgi:hypothetical protein